MEKRAWIEIDISKIIRNIQAIKSYTGKEFMACVKADCYGMGMSFIASQIEQEVDMFGVATASEAMELRESGIKKPVMVLGTVLPGDIDSLVMNGITINLCNEENLRELQRVVASRNREARVHVKVETGLGRIGVIPSVAVDFIARAAAVRGIVVEGVFSHFATADWQDTGYALSQMKIFDSVIEQLSELGLDIPIKHMANSAAIINLPETIGKYGLTRIGLLILGVYPVVEHYKQIPLECAVSGFTRINHVKDVPEGTCLSYGITCTTKRETRVATLGVGYGDGLRRFLSNRYSFVYKDKKVGVLGNICMDQTLIDVTGIDAAIGDKVKLFGDDFGIEEMAKAGGTIPQEILCGFGSKRIEKIFKGMKKS